MEMAYWTTADRKEPILDLQTYFKTQVENGELESAFIDWLGDTETANGIYDFFEHLVYMRGNLKQFYDDSITDFAKECERALNIAMNGDKDTHCLYGTIFVKIKVDI